MSYRLSVSYKRRIDRELGEYIKLAIFRPVHGIYKNHNREYPLGLNIEQALDWWGNHPIRIWFSDDGCFNGDDGHCDVDLNAPIPERRPSAKTWKKLMKYIFGYKTEWRRYSPLLAVEHLPANIKDFDCIKNTIKTISEEYKYKFGEYPENYRKFPKPKPKPEPEPKPQPPQEKKCSCWYYFSGKINNWDIKRFILCIFRLGKKKCK